MPPTKPGELSVLYRLFIQCRLVRNDVPLPVVNALADVEAFYLAYGFDPNGIPRELAEAKACCGVRSGEPCASHCPMARRGVA